MYIHKIVLNYMFSHVMLVGMLQLNVIEYYLKILMRKKLINVK
jgi:hypothetical protein